MDKIFEDDDIDLILVDYNLLGGEKGDEVIEKIRRLDVYTDIVFYSQEGETTIRNSIKEKGVDGVYCSDREQSEFLEKVQKVINTTIKKVVDTNNCRGIVMAYTSELDLKLEELTRIVIEKLSDEEKNKQKANIKAKCIKSLEDRKSNIEKIDPLVDFEKLCGLLDSYHKWRALRRLARTNELLKEYQDMIEKYKDEVIGIRNLLAHGKDEISLDGKKVFRSRIDGYPELEFNDAKAIEIRNNLRKYSQAFQKISESLIK